MIMLLNLLVIAIGTLMQPAPSASTTSTPPPATTAAADREKAVAAVLDQLHELAAKADGARYFALFTPDGIFLGTDATERWTVDQFKAYAKPFFDKGQGWTYRPTQRHIHFSASDELAWFDELLANDKIGQCRGSGVLLKNAEGAWKIAQYNLTKVVPNEKMDDVVKAIGAR